MPPPEIAAEELRFVEEYVKDRNATRAALAAGLADSYFPAAVAASRLLRNEKVAAWVKHLFRLQARRLKTEVPDVVREWAVMGKSDVTDYVVDGEGRVTTAPGVPRIALRAVKKVKQLRTEKLHNDVLTVETRTEIELHDKVTPLTKLYEHLHGVLPGEAAAPAGGMTIDDAVRLRDELRRRERERLGGDVPGGVPVVPEGGAAGGGVPE
jgi:hypothetical protein